MRATSGSDRVEVRIARLEEFADVVSRGRAMLLKYPRWHGWLGVDCIRFGGTVLEHAAVAPGRGVSAADAADVVFVAAVPADVRDSDVHRGALPRWSAVKQARPRPGTEPAYVLVRGEPVAGTRWRFGDSRLHVVRRGDLVVEVWSLSERVVLVGLDADDSLSFGWS